MKRKSEERVGEQRGARTRGEERGPGAAASRRRRRGRACHTAPPGACARPPPPRRWRPTPAAAAGARSRARWKEEREKPAARLPPTLHFHTLAAGWETSISRRMALPSLVRTMPMERGWRE